MQFACPEEVEAGHRPAQWNHLANFGRSGADEMFLAEIIGLLFEEKNRLLRASDIVAGLKAGDDDYVMKPLKPKSCELGFDRV